MADSKDHKAAAEPPLNCRVGQRFNPCETADCRARCDNFGVYCEEICIDEIKRLRSKLQWIATAYYSAPELLRQVAQEALSVPNAEITGRTLAQNEADGA